MMNNHTSRSLANAHRVHIEFMPINARQLQAANGYATFILSVTFNSLLLAVLATERNKTLRAYSNVLRLNCVCDLFYTFVCFATELEIEFDDGKLIIVLVGVYRYLSKDWNEVGLGIYMFSVYICIFIIPVVFYYRYSIVVKRVQLTTIKLLRIFSVVAILAAALGFMIYITIVYDKSTLSCAEALSSPMWTYAGATIDNCLIAEEKNMLRSAYLLCVACVNTAMYVWMIFCTVSIFRALHESDIQLNQKTYRLQRQMNVLLLVQLFLPVICACIPFSIMIICSFLRITIIGLGILLAILVEWVPLLNSLITILLITNYRRRAVSLLKSMFRFCNGHKSSTSTMSNQSATS